MGESGLCHVETYRALLEVHAFPGELDKVLQSLPSVQAHQDKPFPFAFGPVQQSANCLVRKWLSQGTRMHFHAGFVISDAIEKSRFQ